MVNRMMATLKRNLKNGLGDRLVSAGVLIILMVGLWLSATLIVDGYIYGPDKWVRVDELRVHDSVAGMNTLIVSVTRETFEDVQADIVVKIFKRGTGATPIATMKDLGTFLVKGFLECEKELPLSRQLEPGAYYAVFFYHFSIGELWLTKSFTVTTPDFTVYR